MTEFLQEIYDAKLCPKCKKERSWNTVKECKENNCPEQQQIDGKQYFMKLTIIDDVSEKNDSWLNNDGTAVGANGGTEMIRDNIMSRVDPELLKNFKFIHSRVRDNFFEEGKKHVLLLHDTWDDPESQWMKDKNLRARFDKLVFVSNYQLNTYHLAHGIPYYETIVMKNAIDPIQVNIDDKPKDKVNLIYHTTPHRGLDLLLVVFLKMAEKYGDMIHLDVFSSYNIYGQGHKDEPYKEIFDVCREHENITYHGTQSNEVVREALKNAHIFAYPNTWPETSCIAMLEAMSAGCQIICPNFAALPETTANFATMYPFQEDKVEHANMFAHVLDQSIPMIHDEELIAKLKFQQSYTNAFYNWDLRKAEWEGLLRSLMV